MNFKKKSLVIYTMIVSLFLSACSAASSDTSEDSKNSAASVVSSEDSKNSAASVVSSEETQEAPTELSIYKPLHANLQQYVKGNEEIPFYQELEKRTNTKITFLTPPVGQEKEQFNLILASGDYPDIFMDGFSSYVGGASKALKDGIIISLNDLISSNAPNLKKALEEYPEAEKYIKDENGNIFGAPIIYTSPMQLVAWGANVRIDWLNDLGMDLPTTIDDWYQMLKGFKETKGAESPLVFTFNDFKNSQYFAGAYGVATGFYQKDGTVLYGPFQPEYKEYINTLAQWYSEGLIDPDFASLDTKTRNAKMLNGQSGAAYAPTKSGLAAWTAALRETDEEATVGGAPYPTLNEGEKAHVGKVNDEAASKASISSTCKNVEKAMEFLDYGYSEEGHMLFNFGIEGESYTIENGKAIYTDMIMNSTDMPPVSKITMYAPAGGGGECQLYDVGFIEQMNAYEPEINKALNQWSGSNDFAQNIPLCVVPLSDDSSKYSAIMNEVTTYVDEMFLKFVMGQESLENFDTYLETLKGKKIEEATAIMQKAYDSFLNR